jgi:hypothetical protein
MAQREHLLPFLFSLSQLLPCSHPARPRTAPPFMSSAALGLLPFGYAPASHAVDPILTRPPRSPALSPLIGPARPSSLLARSLRRPSPRPGRGRVAPPEFTLVWTCDVLEMCPKGNNNIVIIIFLFHHKCL